MKNKGFTAPEGIRLEFLSAAKKPYIDSGRAIYVSKALSLGTNAKLITAHADSQTSAIIFPDDLPNKKILTELDAIAKLQKPKLRRFKEVYLSGSIGGGEGFSFDDEKNSIALSTADYPGLVADIERTQDILRPVFDKKHYVHIRLFNAQNTGGDRWHKDRYLDPKAPIATRTFGAQGTLIATGKIAINESAPFHDALAGPFKVASAAHAGQGIYLFRGDTVHGVPKIEKGRRWVYIFG